MELLDEWHAVGLAPVPPIAARRELALAVALSENYRLGV